MMRQVSPDHNATVTINQDGTLVVSTNAVNLVTEDKGGPRKLVSVLPSPDENVVKISDHPEHFARLTSLNVSLTNACNLSCTYCYEQHNRDYGRFTVETIKQAADFLRSINDLPNKSLIFFGGEPLIHSRLILDFLQAHARELYDIRINMVTNGLLLTPAFLTEYFSYPNTSIILSLDTFDPAVDKRGIGEKKMLALRESIFAIPSCVKDRKRVTVRPTIGFDTAPGLGGFLEDLYGLGVRSFIVQPLIMGNTEGFLNWGDAEWKTLTDAVKTFMHAHTDTHIEVTEGVGNRTVGNNCLSGYDIISIDPSGDFSGCFFFVNQKDKAGSLISGNIFKGTLFIDREKEFDRQYREMFTKHEECRTCDLQDYCYQCPAGNLDTGGGMYRPDGMCKRFVSFYLTIQNERFSALWKRNMDALREDMQRSDGEHRLKVDLLNMMERECGGVFLGYDEVREAPIEKVRDAFVEALKRETDERPISPDAVMEVYATAPTATWNELHELLLVKYDRQSVRMPEATILAPGGLLMFLALLRTVIYE